MNREEWLTQVCEDHIWPMFAEHAGIKPAAYRVSVGFPKGSRGGNKTIGQCWPTEASADAHAEMFISPELSTGFAAVEVLVHECVHASVGCKAGHKAPFKRLATAVGLTGKMTETQAGPELASRINIWLGGMLPYPHAALIPVARGSKGSRLIKAECLTCGYTVRVTKKWLDVGAPICPTCNDSMAAATAEAEEE